MYATSFKIRDIMATEETKIEMVITTTTEFNKEATEETRKISQQRQRLLLRNLM